jgi:CubicO group peptidase (beta-lactamase class C family)
MIRQLLICFTFSAALSWPAPQAVAEGRAQPTIKELVELNFRPLIGPYQSVLVGVVTPFETLIIPFGTLTKGGEAPSSTTIYEIGSLTKGLLGLVLAQQKLNGSLDLDQPFSAGPGLTLPSFQGNRFTWRQLAQHTSGLPRLPANINPSNPLQPYLDYDLTKLNAFLGAFILELEPGTVSEYSNLGAGLLGYGLEQHRQKPLEALFREVLMDGLSLNDTRIQLSAEQQTRFAPVFLNGAPVEAWQWTESSVLQGAGAFRSTMNDMLAVLKAMMGLSHLELSPVVAEATRPGFSAAANHQIGLFWHRLVHENIIWHNGGTYGSSTFFGYDPDHLVGVVVLSNSQIFGSQGVDRRLDQASITTIQQIAAGLSLERSVQLLREYDSRTERLLSDFAQVQGDLRDKNWVLRKLSHLFDIDQQMRNFHLSSNAHGLSDPELTHFKLAFLRRFHLTDWQSTQDLQSLLKTHGWFTISEWGAQADRQAWLLVQHADNDPEFQAHVLSLLAPLVKQRETSPSNFAYLHDRVAASFQDITKRRPQLFGTQGNCVGPGRWEPLPIEDAENVDLRRAEFGLPPLKDYIESFKTICL